jgi:hypothetical protein
MSKNKAEVAKNVVDLIIQDICNRSGLENAWEDIDDQIQSEIRQEWQALVESQI